MMKHAKSGFTMVEMLVVIGILAILVAVTAGGYSSFVEKAQNVRGVELVAQVQTALGAIAQGEDGWPPLLLQEGAGGSGKLNSTVGAAFANRASMSLTYKETKRDDGSKVYTLTGHDRFGVVSPWAYDVIKRSGSSNISLSKKVPSGGTIEDHILRFAIDDDFDGITDVALESASDGQGKVQVRASACVWCCGRDGKFGTKDDLYSWSKGQEVSK